MTTKAEQEMADSQRARDEHAARQEARATEVQALDTARTAAVAATAEGVDGLAPQHVRELVRALRSGSTWAQAVASLRANRNTALMPSDAALARWKPTLESLAE